ncbi:alpha-(1-_3)-arabinofuranosyltransferase domain-containing protein [Nocardioides marmoraquaticus]
MEPRPGAATTLTTPEDSPRRITAWRLVAACGLLVGLAFVQDAGLVVPDTKLDLVLDPGRFLERALHLWDPASALGQLQNQAYGYLWPMGPFFWFGDLVGAPGWAVQRGWWALVLCTAFLGAALVTRALGVRSDVAVVAAGLAYALSPRLLTVLGPISIEGWPSALAPWVLLPLVVGSTRGDPRRAAALSGLAVAMVGGVNAAATAAVLPLGVLWLLTRERGPRRTALMVWWPVFTALGTLWWLVPLFTLGAYSPPFLDFIESASITTFPTTVFDALRGTSNWVPYVSGSSRAGNDLLVQGSLAVMSAVVVALGLVGLLDRRQPHRWFLGLGLLAGLLLVTMGHLGSVQGLLAQPLHAALDGALAPLRNVHKFDPVVRLPLVVGLGWAVQRLLSARSRDGAVVLATGALALALAVSPALVGRLAPGGAFAEVPGYWSEAAAWLAQEGGEPDTTLLLPGTAFGDYLWGRPQDEPMQSLARSDWAVRNQIPLTPPGGIRALDRVEGAIARGEGSASLTAALHRLGVDRLLVRNDVRPDPDVPEPALVRQALLGSPGIRLERSFGPEVGGAAYLYDGGTRVLVDGGRREQRRALEVWRVDPVGPAAQADVATTGRPAVVVGGPEDVMDLEELRVVPPGAGTVLAPDVPGRDLEGAWDGLLADAPLVLTDGLRARERDFARVHDGYGPVRVPGEARRTSNPTADYLLPSQVPWTTRARLTGVAAVEASSSASDPTALGGADRGRLPFAAVDGDAGTQWSADRGSTQADRWTVRLTSPRELGSVSLTAGSAAAARQRVRVSTPTWTSDPVALGPGRTAVVPVGGRAASEVTVSLVGSLGTLALGEVELPGVQAGRRLDLPRLPAEWGDPDVVVLRSDLDTRRGCVEVGTAVRCSPTLVRDGEEAAGTVRRLVLREGGEHRADLRVRPRPGPGLTALLVGAQPVNALASSVGVPDPRASALAAVDGDPGSAWLASSEDLRPTLRLSWLRPQDVTGVRLVVPDATPVARPSEVVVRWDGGEAAVTLDGDGAAELPAFSSTYVEVEVTSSEPAVDLAGQAGADLPVGIAELSVEGAASLPLVPSTRVRTRPCGTGPTVELQGVALQSSVTASDAQLLAGDAVDADLCDPEDVTSVDLEGGVVDVVARPSEAFDLDSLVLTRSAGTEAQGVVRATLDRRGPSDATVAMPGAGLLALPHNANPGWTARTPDGSAPAAVVDGWRQGFVLGSGRDVQLRFAPDTVYRWGLGAGLLLLAATAGLALWPGRRARHRRDLAAVASAGPSYLLAGATAVAAGLLVAGWPGLALAVPVALVARRLPQAGAYGVAGTVLVAGAAYLVRPWTDPAGWAGELAWPAYLALAPVLVALALAGERSTRRPGQPRNRMAGSSTRR